MTRALYNCKADGDSYRITKFSPDLEVESTYLTSLDACECPAGHRHTCRHRQMLPKFIQKRATSGEFFLDFDNSQWLRAIVDDTIDSNPSTLGELEELVGDSNKIESPMSDTLEQYAIQQDLSINMLSLAQPPAICDLEVTPLQPSPTKPFRRL